MKNILVFLFSSSIIGVVCYKIGYSVSKKKYEHLADEEVSAIRRSLATYYRDNPPGMVDPVEYPEVDPDQRPNEGPNPKKYTSPEPSGRPNHVSPRVNDGPGVDYGKQYRTLTPSKERIPGEPGDGNLRYLEKEEDIVDTTKPYIITPEEFHDSDYEAVTLHYCADKVLTDVDYNQIKDLSIVGGYRILNQMGKYDWDCLYVRSEEDGIDYEIVLEERAFSKITPLGIIDEE